MKLNQLKWGVVLGYLQLFLTIIIGLVYSPIMIGLLGQSEYGLYQTVISAVSTLNLLNLGFNAGYVRWFSKYKSENRQKDIDRLNGIFLSIFVLLGVIAFLGGWLLTYNLHIIYDQGLTEAEYQLAQTLTFIASINIALTFFTTPFFTIITANERFVFVKTVRLVISILTPIFTLILLYAGFKSIALVIVTLILALATLAFDVGYVFKVLKNRFCFKGFEKGVFSRLFGFTFFIALNLIVDQINGSVDKILLGRFQGTAQVAIYSVGFSLYSYYLTLSTSISGVFTAKIHKIIAETRENLAQQKRKVTDLFTRVGRIQFMVLGLFLTGLVLFGKLFIVHFWVGPEYENSYYVMIILALSGTIPLTQNLGIEIQRALNKHKFRSILYACMAVVNVLVSIPLCKAYGAVGATLGTAISFVLVNTLLMNVYYQKACNIRVLEYWKNILSILKAFVVPILFGVLLINLLDLSQIHWFIVGVFSYTAVYCASLWFFGMNDNEKSLIQKPLNKIWGRFSHAAR